MNSKEYRPHNTETFIESSMQGFAGDHQAGLTRKSTPNAKTSQQTQILETTIALNPLVAACIPLLSFATQLREQSRAPDLTQLYQLLCQEVKNFENKTNTLHYRPTLILSARYFICALIDEIILTSNWGENSLWKKQNLLGTFEEEYWSSDRFFVILEQSFEDPKHHLDLLELAYLCISLGYEGMYRSKRRGQQSLGQFTDKLYYLIQNQRGEFSKHLFISSNTTPKLKKTKLRIRPMWLIISVILFGFAIIYLPYRSYLNKRIVPLEQQLSDLSRPYQSTDRYQNE